MKSRRALLAALGLALPGLALAAGAKPAAPQARKAPASRGGRAATGWKVSQAKVKDQHGREFKFYDDLVKNKLVLISFASIDGEKRYPIEDNLVKMRQMIGSRMGKDVFVYTVSTRPERETPEALKASPKSETSSPSHVYRRGIAAPCAKAEEVSESAIAPSLLEARMQPILRTGG